MPCAARPVRSRCAWPTSEGPLACASPGRRSPHGPRAPVAHPGAAVFDLDGTVADSQEGILACLRATLRDYGRRADDRVLRSLIGPPLDESFRGLGFAGAELREAMDHYRVLYGESGVALARPYDGVVATLRALRDHGVRLVLATAKRLDFAERMLTDFGVRDLFETVAGASPDNSLGSKVDIVASGELLLRLPRGRVDGRGPAPRRRGGARARALPRGRPVGLRLARGARRRRRALAGGTPASCSSSSTIAGRFRASTTIMKVVATHRDRQPQPGSRVGSTTTASWRGADSRARSSTTSTAAPSARPRWRPTARTSDRSSSASECFATCPSGPSPRPCWARSWRCRSSWRPVGFAGMFARRAEVQAASAAERAGVPFCESTLSICGIEEVAAAATPPAVVPALRDEGPQLRRGPDGSGPGRRVHDAGPHGRPARRRSALPRRAQRHQRSALARALRRGARPRAARVVGARRRPRRSTR